MTPLGIIRTLINSLSENTTPRQLAGGAALGVIIGLVPKANLTAQILLILMMVFRINVGLTLVVAAVISMLNFLVDPLSSYLGYAVLTAAPLQGLWTYLYNTPVVPWTGFNNTLVTGNLLTGMILFFPVFILTTGLSEKHGDTIKTAVMESKITKALRRSWLVDWYFRMEG